MHTPPPVKQAVWETLGAMDELRAKPIWSAAQRAELAALSEQIHAATVAGETEQLRELLPRASQAVNALLLAAQAAAQRGAQTAAQYVPAPNVGTGGVDLGAADSTPTRRTSRYVRGRRTPGGYLEFVPEDDALPRDARPMRGWNPPITPTTTQHGVSLLTRLVMPFGDVLEGGVGVLRKAWQAADRKNSIVARPLGTLTALGEVFLLKTWSYHLKMV